LREGVLPMWIAIHIGFFPCICGAEKSGRAFFNALAAFLNSQVHAPEAFLKSQGNDARKITFRR